MTISKEHSATRLKINEIFYSLQGESRSSGFPTVFIRLTGCPLRCGYCDTAYAFHAGIVMTLSEILGRVAMYQTQYVTVTGGEPLAQKGCQELLVQLCDLGYEVSLETAGALGISDVDPRVIKVMDIKTPASGEAERNLYANIAYLGRKDQVKFVLCDADDYRWARDIINEYKLDSVCEILFSPAYRQLEASTLADWILGDGLPVRMQIQLHKYLWGDVPGR
jgi:7-carboxy-7-deazaguanine synthase